MERSAYRVRCAYRTLVDAREYLFRRSLLAPLAVLAAATVILLPPLGDFPLNDDWVYARSVQWTLEQGRYVGHPFTLATQVLHVCWGTLFAAVFGFSFDTLRAATLVAAFAASWSVAACARTCGSSRRVAILCGALLWANPIFLSLSYTFMTDVPFLALASIAILFCLKTVRDGRIHHACLAGMFSAASVFVRQYGVAIPIAFVITWLALWGLDRRRARWSVAAGFAIPWVLSVPLWFYWAHTSDTFFTKALAASEGLPTFPEAFTGALAYVRDVAFYMGLFLLPLSFGTGWAFVTRRARWTWQHTAGWLLCVFVLVCSTVALPGWQFPPLSNILRDAGAGPLTLTDTTVLYPGWTPVHLPGPCRWVIAAIAFMSASLLLTGLWFGAPLGPSRSHVRMRPVHMVFLTLSALLFLVLPCNPWQPIVYDRYLLPALAAMLPLGASGLRARRSRTASLTIALVCAVLFVFSLSATQEYLAWNRARWSALHSLIAEHGVDPFAIDGGYEYNGWVTSEEFMKRFNTNDFRDRGPLGWWILDNAYAVSFLPRPGYTIIDRFPYYSSLELGPRDILVLQREVP